MISIVMIAPVAGVRLGAAVTSQFTVYSNQKMDNPFLYLA